MVAPINCRGADEPHGSGTQVNGVDDLVRAGHHDRRGCPVLIAARAMITRFRAFDALG